MVREYLIGLAIVLVVSLSIGVFYVLIEHKRRFTFDIDINEMIQKEKKVRKFFEKYEQQLPEDYDIKDIGKILGLRVGKKKISNLSERARTIKDKDKSSGYPYVVYFRNGFNTFDYAHECGHRMNGDKVPYSSSDGHGKPKREQLASYTGVGLLLRFDRMEKILKDTGFSKCTLGEKMKIIDGICQKYNIDRTTVIRRINEVKALQSTGYSM